MKPDNVVSSELMCKSSWDGMWHVGGAKSASAGAGLVGGAMVLVVK